MTNVFFCKQIYLHEYKDSVFFCKSDEQWLESIEKDDLVFYHLIGGEGRKYVLENMPTELSTFDNLTQYVSKLMKFEGWMHDEKNKEYAKFSTICEFKIPCRKFQALNLFKFNISLLNKSVKQTKGRSFFKLEPVDINKLLEIIDNNKFIEYVNDDSNYRKFEKVDSVSLFDKDTQNIQFVVTNADNREISINTAPSFFDGVRTEIDIKKLQYPLDSGKSFRNKFINYVFRGELDYSRYYDLFTGFWDALCQKSFSSVVKKQKNKLISTEQAGIIDDSDNVDEVCDENPNEIYYKKLCASKNIILRGAPGTGKTVLAKNIAADVVSNGEKHDYGDLSPEQLQQIGFVQFHPNYDYTDFVEGLRPIITNGIMTFQLREGVFKSFISVAKQNYEDSSKSPEAYINEQSAKEKLNTFLSRIEYDVTEFHTINKNLFYVTDADDSYIYISMPNNENIKTLVLDANEIIKMLESNTKFEAVTDITSFFGKRHPTHGYSYDFAIYHEILKQKSTLQLPTSEPNKNIRKQYVFIIDEINRGEISKILGELFYSIDPGCRGPKGAVSTQYQNLHPSEIFYIPDNVYIIGTMNDIDRSVDTFDYAMRRRFRFIEVTPNDRKGMLSKLNEKSPDGYLQKQASDCLDKLNEYICNNVDGLNANYQIGPAYFLKLYDISSEELWTDNLKPLLLDYIQGMPDEDDHIKEFEKIYHKYFPCTVVEAEDHADEKDIHN